MSRRGRWAGLVVAWALVCAVALGFALSGTANAQEPTRPIVDAQDRVLTYPPRGAAPLVCDGITINVQTATVQRWELDFRMAEIPGPDRFAASEHATTRLTVLSDVRFDARGKMRGQPDWDVVFHHWNIPGWVGNGYREMAFSNTYKMTPGLWAFESRTTGDVSGIVTETLCLVQIVAPPTAFSAALSRQRPVPLVEWLQVTA